MSKNKGLSKELADKMRYFVHNTSPNRISKNIRALLFGYLRNQAEGMPVDLEEILNDLEALFDLLEVAADEKKLK